MGSENNELGNSIHPLPFMLPKALNYCNQARNAAELLDLLVKKPADLLEFFEILCADETWAENHPELTCNLIDWLTTQSFYDRLTEVSRARAAQAIQRHFSVLDPRIPRDILLIFKDGEIGVNALLLAAASPFFRELLLQCLEKQQHFLSFPSTSKSESEPIIEFINTGSVADLWRASEEETFTLLNRASVWRIEGLLFLCETAAKKYLTKKNVAEMIPLAKKKSWTNLLKEAINFFNERSLGFVLDADALEDLGIKFNIFNEEVRNHYQPIKHLITRLIYSKGISNINDFSLIVADFKFLRTLDLTNSEEFALENLSSNFIQLNVSQCSWLDEEALEQMSLFCPDLQALSLQSNTQLNYLFWGGLAKQKNLKHLDLSFCHQIRDEELSMIISACPKLESLNLEGCYQIHDHGFLEIKKLPKISHLNLSHTHLTDAPLIQLASCESLTILDLERCADLTEKGIYECTKHAAGLKILNLRFNKMTDSVLIELQKIKPHLKILAE